MLLCATPSSILAGTLLAFLRPDVPAKVSHRTVTFEERVAHQRAIEEVYWRHRIWPKERPDPKPSLDAVMSQAQLEKKVTDYVLAMGCYAVRSSFKALFVTRCDGCFQTFLRYDALLWYEHNQFLLFTI
jgi:hypothetical protein